MFLRQTEHITGRLAERWSVKWQDLQGQQSFRQMKCRIEGWQVARMNRTQTVRATGTLYCSVDVGLKMALLGGNHGSVRAEVLLQWSRCPGSLVAGLRHPFQPYCLCDFNFDFVETCSCWHPALKFRLKYKLLLYPVLLECPQTMILPTLLDLCASISLQTTCSRQLAVVIHLGCTSDWLFHLTSLSFPCQ